MKPAHPAWMAVAPIVLIAAVCAVVSAASAPAPAPAQEQEQEQESPPVAADEDEAALPPIWYAAILRPGPKWTKGVPPADQVGIDQHLDHLVRHFQAGSIVLAGPFLDDSGGLAVLRAGSVEDARKIVAADPTVKSGLLKVENVHPWLVPLSALVEPRLEDEEGTDDDEADRAR